MAKRRVKDVDAFCEFVVNEANRRGVPKFVARKIMKDCLKQAKNLVIPGLEQLPRRKKATARMPIETMVIVEAAKAMKDMFPQIHKLHLVGSRLRRKIGRDIEFIAVVKQKRNLPGRNIIDMRFGPLKVDLFFSLPNEVETHILEFGLGLDNIRWKKRARDLGFKLNRFGLFKRSVLVTNKMRKIAKILGLPLKPFLLDTLRNPL